MQSPLRIPIGSLTREAGKRTETDKRDQRRSRSCPLKFRAYTEVRKKCAGLEWLVRAGFTHLEALQTATINPATYLDRTRDLGTVEAGKIADLVVLARNPLVSIGNTRSVVAVVADGRFYSATELNKLRLHLMDLAAQ